MFFFGQLKHEVRWKSFSIAFYLFVEAFDGHAIEFRNIRIEHHSLMTEEYDTRFHGVNGGRARLRFPRQFDVFRFVHFEVAICDLNHRSEKRPIIEWGGVATLVLPLLGPGGLAQYRNAK